LCRNNEIILIQRRREQKFGPRIVNQLVLNNRVNRFTKARYQLDGTFGFSSSLGNVEQSQFSHPGDSVMPRNNTGKLGGTARYRSGIEQTVGPIAVAAIELRLVRAIGVHVEQDSGEIMRCVDILPAEIQDATVCQEHGTPILVLLESELPNRFAVGFQTVNVADRTASVNARYTHHVCRRDEQRRTIGNVASFDVVHVRPD